MLTTNKPPASFNSRDSTIGGDRQLTGARLRLDGGFHRVLWLENLSDFELPSVIDISAHWRVFQPLFGELTGFDYDSRLGDPQLEGCDGVLPPFGDAIFTPGFIHVKQLS